MSFTSPNFTTALLRQWLQQYNTTGALIHVDKMPVTGRAILLTRQPGAGLEMEGLVDNPSFTVSVRGGENNFADAERIALQMDRIILEKSDVGFEFGGVYFYLIDRTGGAPQQVNIIDRNNRFSFSCTYYAKISTNIGEVFS